MKNDLSRETQALIYAQQNGLLNDRVGRAVGRIYRYGAPGEFAKGVLHSRVNRDKIERAWCPFRRPTQLRRGDLLQGMDLLGNEIRYPSRLRGPPCVIVCTTGGGKTTLTMFEAIQFARLVEGMWLFDLRKEEYPRLQGLLARDGVRLNVVRARQMKVNPLQVPFGVDPISYASNVADSLVGVLDLPPVAQRLLFQAIVQEYEIRGVLNGSVDYPTLFDLLEAIRANPQSNKQASDAAVVRLETVLLSLKTVLCYRRGYSTHDLSKLKIAFVLNEISQVDQDLLLNWLLLSEFMSRVARGISNQQMTLKIFVDEASRLVAGPQSCFSSWIGLIRGMSISLTLSNQSAVLDRSILSNSPNKVIGQCACASDYDVMGAAMGLTADEKRWCVLNLKKPGLFLMSLAQGARPFLFVVPPLTWRHIPDIDYSCPSLNALSVDPAPEFYDWEPQWLRRPAVVRGLSTEQTVTAPRQAIEVWHITPPELSFLKAVIENPHQPVSYYPPQVGIGASRAIKIRKSLIEKGLLQQDEVSTNPRGRPSKLLFPTDKGIELVGSRQ